MAGANRLHRLALAAIGRAPKRPLIARADRVYRIPELGGDPRVRRVLQHAAELAALDLPPDLAAELEVVALVVDRPGAVGLHVDPIVGAADELLERERLLAREDRDVRHADDGQAAPPFCAHRSAGTLETDHRRGVT